MRSAAIRRISNDPSGFADIIPTGNITMWGLNTMAKRPDNQETLVFALELLRRIPRKSKVTAKELQVQLQGAGLKKNLRTVQRQLKMLNERFDIECDDREKPYGYRWKEQAEGFSVPRLSLQDSLLLTLAEQYLRKILPARLMKSMKGFFTQARYELEYHSGRHPEQEWLSKVRIVDTTQPLLPPKIKPDVLEAVSNALYENKWLKLKYENADGKRGNYRVMPLGLAQQGPRLYLVCRFQDFDNERSLALHRIISAEVSTMSFDRPSEFDLKKYDDDGRFGFGEGERIRLTFRIAKPNGLHLLESPLSKDQQVTELDEEYEITATVVDTEQLNWWLRGFGDTVKDVEKEPIANIKIKYRR